jgi:hypothetical protein
MGDVERAGVLGLILPPCLCGEIPVLKAEALESPEPLFTLNFFPTSSLPFFRILFITPI